MRHDLVVLSDEVYWALRYGDGRTRACSTFDGMADRTILLDGWSKTYAMTGWRLGFGVFPAALVEPVTRLAINSVSCTSAFSQYAAIAALDGPAGRRRGDGGGVPRAPRRDRRRAQRDRRGQLRRAAGRVLRVPQHRRRPASAPTSWRAGCCARPGWRRWPAPRSAGTGRGFSGSRTPTRSPTSRRRWTRSNSYFTPELPVVGRDGRESGPVNGRLFAKRVRNDDQYPTPNTYFCPIWRFGYTSMSVESYTLASQMCVPSTAAARVRTGSCRFTCGYDMNMRGQSDERPRRACNRAAASQPD